MKGQPQNPPRSRHVAMVISIVAAVFILAACGDGPGATTAATVGAPAGVGQPSSPSLGAVASVPPGSARQVPSTSVNAPAVVGTVVRFTSASTSVDVTIGEDNPTVRDFLSMVPMSLSVEEFSGREKIAYPPRKLVSEGSPGSDPEDGDLIYYVPWGNLGFDYNASGIGFSDDTIHLGTYQASPEQLQRLEGEAVTIEMLP